METGDPKQVAILGVLAVGALGFLGFRALGKPVPPPVQATARKEGAKVERTARLLPPANDPFSHPKLAPPVVKEEAAAPDPKVEGKFPAMPTPLMGAYLPNVEGPASTEVRPMEPKKPAEPKVEAPKGTVVALEATAGASDAVAFLSVEGRESQPFHPQDRVANGIRLLRIEDGSVILRGPKGELTLNVGEQKRI